MIESPDIISRLRKLVEDGGGFFSLFDRALVSRSRMLELFDMLQESLPSELDLAAEVLSDKEKVLEKAVEEAGQVIDEAVARAEKLVDIDAITLEARKKADEIAQETDQYVMEHLTKFESELVKILNEVRAGIKSVGTLARNDGISPSGELDNS